MPRQRLAYVDAELSERTTNIDITRAISVQGRTEVARVRETSLTDESNRHTGSESSDAGGWRQRTTPPVGSIGYTGSYCEPSVDVVEVSMVSVLEARGPD
jgi:hypothetical protein